jgi:hypothetical protein
VQGINILLSLKNTFAIDLFPPVNWDDIQDKTAVLGALKY